MLTAHFIRNGVWAATATWRGLGDWSVTSGDRPAVARVLSSLLEADFEQSTGFPPVHGHAEAGSLDAFRMTCGHVAKHFSFALIGVRCVTTTVTGLPILREAESDLTVRSFLIAGLVTDLLRRAASVFDARARNRRQEALRFGSLRQLRWQEWRAAAVADPRRRRPFLVSDPTPHGMFSLDTKFAGAGAAMRTKAERFGKGVLTHGAARMPNEVELAA